MAGDDDNPPLLTSREQMAAALLGLRCEAMGCTALATWGIACEVRLPPSETHLVTDGPLHYHLKCDQHARNQPYLGVPIAQLSHLRIENGRK